jgi:hypothetical protein
MNFRRCYRWVYGLLCALLFPAMAAQAQELRIPPDDSGRVEATAEETDQEHLSSLRTATTLLSACYYGPALMETFRVKDEGTKLSFCLAMGGLGYFLPQLLAPDGRVTEGMATLAVHGGIRGIFDGWMLYKMATGRDSTGEDFFADKNVLGAGVAGSLAELGIGYMIAKNADMSAGTANMITTCGNLGLGLGCEAYAMITTDEVDDVHYAGLFGSMLGCSALGYVAGSMFANGSHYTTGDTSVFSAASLLGSALPPALATLSESENSRLYFGLSMAGCLGAAVLADRFLASRDFTTSQGNAVGLGMLGGMLAGWGLGFAVTGDDDAEPNAPWAALGAAGGFALMLGIYSGEASTAAKGSAWNIQVNPAGLASVLIPRASHARAPLPLLGVSAAW